MNGWCEVAGSQWRSCVCPSDCLVARTGHMRLDRGALPAQPQCVSRRLGPVTRRVTASIFVSTTSVARPDGVSRSGARGSATATQGRVGPPRRRGAARRRSRPVCNRRKHASMDDDSCASLGLTDGTRSVDLLQSEAGAQRGVRYESLRVLSSRRGVHAAGKDPGPEAQASSWS